MTESQVMTLAAGPWLPDLPPLNNPGVTVARNLLPISSRGYAPMPSFVPLSQAVPGRIVGLFSTKDRNGNPYNFVGTDGGILRLDGASLTWQPMIPVEQFKGSSEGFWAMVTYGERLICSNGNDPIYSLNMGVDSNFSRLSTDPDVPIAKYLAVVRDWLVAANLRGSDDRAYPQRIQWSAIDDPTDWPPPGSDQAIAKQSDFQELVGAGGEIQGIVGNLGSADAAIFQERAIFRMSFVGPPAIFSFHQVEGARGTAAPGSIISVGALAFYLGEDGFYQFDGTSSIPIGSEKVNKSFFRDLDMVYISRICAAVDPINTIVFWAYPGTGNIDGIPNRILAYNWMLRNEDGSVGRWTIIHATCQVLGRTLTEGKTLEQLDGFPVTRNQQSGIDGLPFSLDSRVWMGGKPILAAVNLASCLALATGVGMAATLETAEFEAFPGRMTLVNRVTPLSDGATVKAAVMSRSSQSDTAKVTVSPRSMVGGSLFTRALARYHRLSLTVEEGGFSTMNGVTVEVQAGGIR